MENLKDNYNILLNFLPLKGKEFKFTIYRKENKGARKENIYGKKDIFSYTLPKKDDTNERTNYWISFEKSNDFEEFVCDSSFNHKLTQQYLYYYLIKKVQEVLQNEEFIIPSNKFEKTIYLILKLHEEGKECIVLSPYYLAEENKFGFIVDFKFLKDHDAPFDRKVQQLSLSLDKNFNSNSNFYIDKFKKIEQFKTKFYDKLFPLKIENKNEEIGLEESFVTIPADKLKTKTYLVGNSKESNSQFMGIKNYGPYEPINTDIILLFFFKVEYKQFAIDLADAIKGNLSTFNGLKDFFGIPKITFKTIQISEEDFVQKVKTEINNNNNKTLIPIIVLSKKEEDKYYQIKYNALLKGQAVQFVSLELLKNKESLKWSASNIGLQIFAKLGGIPWIVKPENQKSLIIGVSQSHKLEKENNGTKITKYFAYSVLIDSSGRYKELKSIGKYTIKEDYLNALSAHIKKIVDQYIEFNNIIIHCPFKIRRFELETIKTTIEQLNANKTFLMLKINTDNKYFGFNMSANSLVPYESTYVQLSNNEFLIWFEGLQYHNPNVNKRIAGPTHIEFYYSNKNLTLDDKKSFLQDVINLSGANWRGFNSKSTPISIHYPRLVSKFIQHLSKYGEINIENIKPWFL